MSLNISREIGQVRNAGQNWLARALEKIQAEVNGVTAPSPPPPVPPPSPPAPGPGQPPPPSKLPTYFPFLEVGDLEIVNTPWTDVRAYGNAVCGAGLQAYHGAMAAGSNILTLYTTGPLGDDTFGDVKGFSILASGQSGQDLPSLYTTIASVQSASQVTLNTAAPANGISGGIITATIVAGGSGYAVNDLVEVVFGSDVTCQLQVSAVSGGAVTGFTVAAEGTGYVGQVGNTLSTSHITGSGTGFTIKPTVTNYSAEVYWWPPNQEDSRAIQSAISSGNPRVYMPAGVYVVQSQLPFTYAPTLRELFGDGTQKTVILCPTDNPGQSFFHFTDAHDLSIHDFTTRGPGQDGVFGGDWNFDIDIYSNIERVKLWNLEIKHSASAHALYLNTPIISSFRNIRIIYNAGVGMQLFDSVSCNVDDCYSLTNFGADYLFQQCYSTHLSGCAAEASGVHFYFLDCYGCTMTSCDSEQPSHQAPTVPGAAPGVAAVSGGSIPNGAYTIGFTWYRQAIANLSLPLESYESATAPLTLSGSDGTIAITIPAAPTDVPFVTQFYAYINGSQNGPYTIPNGGGTVDITALSGSVQGPPIVSAIGHHVVVAGGASVAVNQCTFNTVPVVGGRFYLTVQDAQGVVPNGLSLVQPYIQIGPTVPTYLVEIDAATNLWLDTSFTAAQINGAQPGFSLSGNAYANTLQLGNQLVIGLGAATQDNAINIATATGAPDASGSCQIGTGGNPVNGVSSTLFGIAETAVAWNMALDMSGNFGVAGAVHSSGLTSNGLIDAAGSTVITSNPPSSSQNEGWKLNLWSNGTNIYSFGVAGNTLAVMTNFWFSLFPTGTPPANNAGGANNPDTAATISFSTDGEIVAKGTDSGLSLYDRNASANRFIWYMSAGTFRLFSSVAGVDVLSIDSSGNMIIKGTLTQNGTPA